MSKPMVRVVLDKDALLSMFPNGEFETHLELDNAVINLIKETSKKYVQDTIVDNLDRDIKSAAEELLGYSYRNTWSTEQFFKGAIDKVIEREVRSVMVNCKAAIDGYLEKFVEESKKSLQLRIEELSGSAALHALLSQKCREILEEVKHGE
jgi:hypothetical protein